MANNHSIVYNLSLDGEFRARFAAALAAYVQVVFAEPATTPNHAERLVSAAKVLNDPMSYSVRFSLAAAAALGGVMPSDAALDQLVTAWWTALALRPAVP